MDLTSKGLRKPTEPEAADVVDLNYNSDRINAYGMGSYECTSGTRPASPWAGLTIFETDTKCTLVWDGAAWKPRGTVICTSATRPTPVVEGQEIYETDTKYLLLWNGTAWTSTAWIASTLLNNWVNFGQGFQLAAYRRVNDNVEIRGTIKSGTGVVFTLPAGFLPVATEAAVCTTNGGPGELRISATGDVTIAAYWGGGTNAIVSIKCRFSTL